MIYIAEHQGYENNKHTLVITKKSISKEEYVDFYSNFKICSQIHQFKEIHEICLEANYDLRKFLSVDNLNKMLREEKTDPETVLRTGNKLLLNYTTALKVMVEKIESYLKHNQPDKTDEFKKICSYFYDNKFSYRFFIRLRNYIIHNGMPFTKIKTALNQDCNLYIDRNNLLKWDGWSTVKKDLQQMENINIVVQPFLEEIGGSIYAIYLQSLYYLFPELKRSLENIENFLKKYNVGRVEFVEYRNGEDIQNGGEQYHLVPWERLINCVDELNKHPEINIRFVNE